MLRGWRPGPCQLGHRWLGSCAVTVKPVIDLAGQAPVDAYEIPDRLREAVHLRSPADVFPHATNLGRTKDVDHTKPYHLPPDTTARRPDDGDPSPGAGPPAHRETVPQTRLDNLAPMTRFHHRIKTHGGWQVTQVSNGVFVWRSPHGYLFLVDATGTRPLGLHTAA